jgi:hypothetical protein
VVTRIEDSRIAGYPIAGIVAEVTEIGRYLLLAYFLLLFGFAAGSLTASRPIPRAFIIEGISFAPEGVPFVIKGKVFIIVENHIHFGNLFLDN